jgi:uncharacterized protein
MSHGHWVWYELMTDNVAGAKAFYEAVVPGWTLSPGTPETANYGFIANADGGMTGGLLAPGSDMASTGAPPGWLGYLSVRDCDGAVSAIVAAGGKCLMPPRDADMAGRFALVTDCCGAPFYVMTPVPPPGGGESTAFSQTLPGRVAWNELLAGDQARAVGFYTSLFDWTLGDAMDMGPMGTYQFVNHEEVGIGAIMQAPPDGPQGWAPYFRVPGIAAAAAAITDHGGTIINGPMDVPGGEQIVQGIDPQGHVFSLVGAA